MEGCAARPTLARNLPHGGQVGAPTLKVEPAPSPTRSCSMESAAPGSRSASRRRAGVARRAMGVLSGGGRQLAASVAIFRDAARHQPAIDRGEFVHYTAPGSAQFSPPLRSCASSPTGTGAVDNQPLSRACARARKALLLGDIATAARTFGSPRRWCSAAAAPGPFEPDCRLFTRLATGPDRFRELSTRGRMTAGLPWCARDRGDDHRSRRTRCIPGIRPTTHLGAHDCGVCIDGKSATSQADLRPAALARHAAKKPYRCRRSIPTRLSRIGAA